MTVYRRLHIYIGLSTSCCSMNREHKYNCICQFAREVKGERLQGERPRVCGEKHVCGKPNGRTQPQGERPGRTARANGSRKNGSVCVWGDTCVWGNTKADTAPGPTARANGQNGSRANGPVCVGGHMCVCRHIGGHGPMANGQGERPGRTALGRTAPCV